jgi:hypothetical protein
MTMGSKGSSTSPGHIRLGSGGLLLALAIALPAHAQTQERWTLAAQTGTQSFLVSVDPARARGNPELRQLTVLMIKRSSPAGIPQVASENDWLFDCVARTWRWTASRALNSSGEVFDTNWTATDWTPLKQDAMGYMSGFACGDTQPIGPEYASAKAAIDAPWKPAKPEE